MPRLTDVVWRQIVERLRHDHPEIFASWITQLRPASLDHGELVVEVLEPSQRVYLEEIARQALASAARSVLDHLVGLRVVLAEDSGSDITRSRSGSSSGFWQLPADAWDSYYIPLNRDYTFERFVVGPCNRLAHAAASAVSENPGKAYNPLFVCGQVGVGKTHLLQAICHTVKASQPDARILFLNSETFINHYIDSVSTQRQQEFRYRYRHVDVLVVDDVQFLNRGMESQDEFFHTFNTLYQVQKQIIISSDKLPSEIKQLEERLVSRFSWGLVAKINEPCFETRMAILRRKTQQRGVQLDNEVLQMLAGRSGTNVRELEGFLNRLISECVVRGEKSISSRAAQELLDELNGPAEVGLRVQDVLDAVQAEYGLKSTDIHSRKRSRNIAHPRQVAMYLTRTLTRLSFEEIGRHFGGRDHTTVIHAVKVVEEQRSSDRHLAERLEKLASRLTNRRRHGE